MDLGLNAWRERQGAPLLFFVPRDVVGRVNCVNLYPYSISLSIRLWMEGAAVFCLLKERKRIWPEMKAEGMDIPPKRPPTTNR